MAGVICSLCRSPIGDPNVAPTCHVVVDSQRVSVGRYCSDRCRAAVAAAIAIRTSTTFAPRDRRERAEALVDALLVAWREQRGPEPSDVAAALCGAG